MPFQKMNRHLLQLLGCFTFILSPTASAALLQLNDGSAVNADFLPGAPEDHLKIKIPQSQQAIILPFSALEEVNFNPKKENKTEPSFTTKVKLRNGDTLPCRFNAFEGGQAKLSVAFAKEPISIPRQAIDFIRFNFHESKILEQFPTSKKSDPNDWSDINTGWEPKSDGSIASDSQSALGKEIKNLPDTYQCQLTLSQQGSHTNMRIHLNSNILHETRSPQESICLNISRNGIQAAQYHKTRYYALSNFDTKILKINTEEPFKITIFVNRSEKKIAFQINDLEPSIHKLRFKNEDNKNFMIKASPNRENYITIHKINFLEWNGNFDIPRQPTKDSPTADILRDMKGNLVSGSFTKFVANDEAAVTFKARFSDESTSLPTKNVHSIFLIPPAEPTNYISTHVLTFTNQQKITFEKAQFSETQLLIDHPILGELAIDFSDIMSISKK